MSAAQVPFSKTESAKIAFIRNELMICVFTWVTPKLLDFVDQNIICQETLRLDPSQLAELIDDAIALGVPSLPPLKYTSVLEFANLRAARHAAVHSNTVDLLEKWSTYLGHLGNLCLWIEYPEVFDKLVKVNYILSHKYGWPQSCWDPLHVKEIIPT